MATDLRCHGCGFQSALEMNDPPKCKLCGRCAGDIGTEPAQAAADEPHREARAGDDNKRVS